jgi:hypothetical protein
VRHAAADRFDRLEFNVYPSGAPVLITNNNARAEARKVIDGHRGQTGIELTEEEVLESPHAFIGSVNGLIDKFQWLRSGSASAPS